MLRIFFINLFVLSASLLAMEGDADTVEMEWCDEDTVDDDVSTEEYDLEDEDEDEEKEDLSLVAPIIPLELTELGRELATEGSIRNTIWAKLRSTNGNLTTAHHALRYPIWYGDDEIPRMPSASYGTFDLKGTQEHFNQLNYNALSQYARMLIDEGIFIYESAIFRRAALLRAFQSVYKKSNFQKVKEDWQSIFKAAGLFNIEIFVNEYEHNQISFTIFARKRNGNEEINNLPTRLLAPPGARLPMLRLERDQ